MAEATPPIPARWWPKVRWTLEHHPWIFLLGAVEATREGHPWIGAILLLIFFVDLYVVSNWDKIAAYLGVRKVAVLYIGFAVVGILLVGIAVGGLLGNKITWSSEPTLQSTGRITWNFDQTASGQGYFLNINRLNQEEARIVGFGAHGKNTSKDPITQFNGYVRSDLTNARLPIYIMAQNLEVPSVPGLFHVDQIPTRPEETFGIPGLADFDIVTHEQAIIESGKSGMPLSKFIREFGSFTVILEYDGIKVERHFTNEEVKKQIELFENSTNPQRTTIPRVTRKSNAAAPIEPTLPFPKPAQTQKDQVPSSDKPEKDNGN